MESGQILHVISMTQVVMDFESFAGQTGTNYFESKDNKFFSLSKKLK